MSYDPLKLQPKHYKTLAIDEAAELWKNSVTLKKEKKLVDAIDVLKTLYCSCDFKSWPADGPTPPNHFEIAIRLAFYLQSNNQNDAAWAVYQSLVSKFPTNYHARANIENAQARMLKKENKYDHAALHYSMGHIFSAWKAMDIIHGQKEAAKKFTLIPWDESKDHVLISWQNTLNELKDRNGFQSSLSKFLGKKSTLDNNPIASKVSEILETSVFAEEVDVLRSIECAVVEARN